MAVDDKSGKVVHLPTDTALETLRNIFKGGKADEFNLCLFPTSGIHGNYSTIEQVEQSVSHPPDNPDQLDDELTFVIIHPRLTSMMYGNCKPTSRDDFKFLKKLRKSSLREFSKIGGSI